MDIASDLVIGGRSVRAMYDAIDDYKRETARVAQDKENAAEPCDPRRFR